VKQRYKVVRTFGAESPSVHTTEFGDGSARVALTYFTKSERAGVRTQVEHVVDFRLDYEEIACVGGTLAASLRELQNIFNKRMLDAKDVVRRSLDG